MPEAPKFQRTYLLSIQGRNDKSITYSVVPPLTVEFDIVRNLWGGANTGKFRIYNLAANTRNDLFHVRYDSEEKEYQKIVFSAGYANSKEIPVIFLGNVRVCGTQRSGVDWITEIDAYDGDIGMICGQISISIPATWTEEQILKTLVGKMPFTQYGAKGDIKIQRKRSISMVGPAWEVCKRLVGDSLAYVDMNTAYFINENEYIARPGQEELVIGPRDILGTPRKEGGVLELDIIFNPSVFVAQAVTIESKQTIFNNTYQLRGIRHRGVISEGICGEAITTLQLWTGVDGVMQKVEIK